MATEFIQTQIITDAYSDALVQFYDSLTPAQVKAFNTIKAFKDSAKTIGQAEGMQPGDIVTSKDGAVVLECKKAPGARISKQSLIDLGELGQIVVGLFNEAHKNDPKTPQFAIMDTIAHDIEVEEVLKYLATAERCKRLAEEYRKTHPEEFPSNGTETEEVSQ